MTTAQRPEQIEIVDDRDPEWFTLDYDRVDMTAKQCGAIALSVYTALVRGAGLSTTRTQLANYLNLTPMDVWVELTKLHDAHVISIADDGTITLL